MLNGELTTGKAEGETSMSTCGGAATAIDPEQTCSDQILGIFVTVR